MSKLRGCGLLSDGDPGCSDVEDDPATSCIINCYSAASCDELELVLCYDPGADTSFGTCAQSCIEELDFTCDDGGTTIPESFKCDGENDCADGTDEQGCPPGTSFVCDDGTSFPASYECDGFDDCADGSDEQGCPAGTSFVCDDGTTFPADYECDGFDDCADGSDERGCPAQAQVVCPAGSPGAQGS